MNDHWAKPFCCMPVAIFKDSRLTKTALRVMGVLAAHANRVTGECVIKRNRLTEQTGLPLCRISEATALLVKTGWLKKTGSGGRSMATTYRLTNQSLPTAPETITEIVTVTDSVTVTEVVTDTSENRYNFCAETVTESIRGNKQSYLNAWCES